MINNDLINFQSINTGQIPVSANIQNIQIGSLGLSISPYIASYVNDSVDTEINDFMIPQNNGRGLLSYFKRSRQISIDITIQGNTKEEFIQNMDRLRGECFKPENILYYKRGELARRQIKVTCLSFPENYEHYNLTFLKTSISFIALEPFWYEETRQSTSIDIRNASFVEEITNKGTDVSQPIIYMVVQTGEITNTTITVGNKVLEITQTLIAGDVLIINSEDLLIEYNGVNIDYSGEFPEMEKGANFFNFNLTGTFELKTLVLNKINFV